MPAKLHYSGTLIISIFIIILIFIIVILIINVMSFIVIFDIHACQTTLLRYSYRQYFSSCLLSLSWADIYDKVGNKSDLRHLRTVERTEAQK